MVSTSLSDNYRKGQIDILTVYDQFWVVVIESKQAALSLEVGKAQLLTYMLANPHPDRPTFGLILNGSNFRFLYKRIHLACDGLRRKQLIVNS